MKEKMNNEISESERNVLKSFHEPKFKIVNAHIVKLDLSYRKPISILENIGNLTFLEDLDLGGNKLTSLPNSIGNLKNLKHLRLYNNQLAFLPDSFGNLRICLKITYPIFG